MVVHTDDTWVDVAGLVRYIHRRSSKGDAEDLGAVRQLLVLLPLAQLDPEQLGDPRSEAVADHQ